MVLIVVDGLDARQVNGTDTPTLAHAWEESRWCPRARSLASMPTRTNPNHVTLMTGVEPEAHGITGNVVWDRTTGTARKLGAAEDLLTETVFTLARRAEPALRTAVAVGKPKLGIMFAASSGRQTAPDEMWDPRGASDASKDDITGYAYDGTTLAAARDLVEHANVDFLFINLSDVDRVSHGVGPWAPQAVETRRRTDAALAAFVTWLSARDDWRSTTVIVTADHGFDTIDHPPVRFSESLANADLRGLVTAGDGGVGHISLQKPGDPSGDASLLAAARRLALVQPAIAEALYLNPNGHDGGARHTLASVHPDWHLAHERTGDLLLVARPGYQLVDGSGDEVRLIGNHGGPEQRDVPAIVLSGAPLGPGQHCDDLKASDLGRTVQFCLGLPEVRRLDGKPIAAADRGRILPGICPTSASLSRRKPAISP